MQGLSKNLEHSMFLTFLMISHPYISLHFIEMMQKYTIMSKGALLYVYTYRHFVFVAYPILTVYMTITVWHEILAENLIWRIGGCTRELPN